MIQIRPAKEEDIGEQKAIWKLCFGDDEKLIDLYYALKYKAKNTVLLLRDNKVASMLTMIPLALVTSCGQTHKAVMLYAIATHPSQRNQGFASQLIDYTNEYLKQKKIPLSLLVPANSQLFDFYARRGYENGFSLFEASISRETIEHLPVKARSRISLTDAEPKQYNLCRNDLLKGRPYLKYPDPEIAFQKTISRLTGADIYLLGSDELYGCMAVERVSDQRIILKELLLPQEFLPLALQHIACSFPAQKYIIRIPAYQGRDLGFSPRVFGMYKALQNPEHKIISEDLAYLGLAFD